MVRKKQKVEENKLVDSTGFWVLVVAAIALILIGLIIYWVNVFTDDSYYNYEGKGGEYKIGRSKVGNVIFYHISVIFDNREYIYSFRNHPEDLEYLYLEFDLDLKLNRPNGIEKLYVTMDPELPNMTNNRHIIAAVAFEQILGVNQASLYNIDINNAYTSEYRNSTVATCSDVDEDTAVIYLKLGEEEKVYSENDCIVIQGIESESLIRSSEKFAYYLLGVF